LGSLVVYDVCHYSKSTSFGSLFSSFVQTSTIGLFRILVLMLSVTVPAVALVHKEVHQWAQQDNQKGEIRKDVSAVFHKEKIECGANKSERCQAVKTDPVSGFASHWVSPVPILRQRC
jgi:hypothetical protein